MRVLELFSGTGSVGNVCKSMNYDVVSLDLDFTADINVDILDWSYTEYPVGYFDIIWASPPCTTFSNLRRSWIGRKLKKHGDKVITKEILDLDMMEGVKLLNKTKEITKYFQPRYWFIENPATGRMKEFNTELPFYDVDYCKYGFAYKKRTRIWTNLQNFNAQRCNRDCAAIMIIYDEKKQKERILHANNTGNSEKLSALMNAKHVIKYPTNTAITYGVKPHTIEAYRIPYALIYELFSGIQNPTIADSESTHRD